MVFEIFSVFFIFLGLFSELFLNFQIIMGLRTFRVQYSMGERNCHYEKFSFGVNLMDGRGRGMASRTLDGEAFSF